MPPRVPLTPPVATDQLLLHTCCAPCSTAIVECLLDNGITPVLYYFNPNIHPEREYRLRKAETIAHAERLGLRFIDADYDPADWVARMRGLEQEPERGKRCARCFDQRLRATAAEAAAQGLTLFATTLSTSRWKDLAQIDAAGAAAAAANPGVHYWARNWRKQGLTERRNQLVRELDFYQQTYCGCLYSLRDARARERGQPRTATRADTDT
ncbi:hypothetical protein MARPU_05930 [Marichromatium purpuratum 984]|uniref:Epoxyqueuosine reductase QueH n=1 Tax=Marichromatium purpuratum 984 TaxID=765910 RepID=W0E1Q9_MARPU|nr:epoxyqueuosine reductase QueH [Marichromatium purpuratum]AHF03458.1 hypothetical protein MARPU_05930 [Marichromatium purpuratum 984]